MGGWIDTDDRGGRVGRWREPLPLGAVALALGLPYRQLWKSKDGRTQRGSGQFLAGPPSFPPRAGRPAPQPRCPSAPPQRISRRTLQSAGRRAPVLFQHLGRYVQTAFTQNIQHMYLFIGRAPRPGAAPRWAFQAAARSRFSLLKRHFLQTRPPSQPRDPSHALFGPPGTFCSAEAVLADPAVAQPREVPGSRAAEARGGRALGCAAL